MSFKLVMKDYIGTKIIKAFPMTRQAFNHYMGKSSDPKAEPVEPGYLVEYDDTKHPNHPNHEGYVSWSPGDVFERSYYRLNGLTFGQAIEALKAGKRVARAGWNGKNMELWLKPAKIIKSEDCKDPILQEYADKHGGEIEGLGTICMYTINAQGRRAILTGWLASQTDMLSSDWEITN